MKINGLETKTKEDLLDIYFNLLSARGQVVEYKWMKNLSKEELITRINEIDEDYNVIVYESDFENNITVYKATLSDDKRVLKYCGKTIIIETPQSFIEGIAERRAEGNKIDLKEEIILKELAKRSENK